MALPAVLALGPAVSTLGPAVRQPSGSRACLGVLPARMTSHSHSSFHSHSHSPSPLSSSHSPSRPHFPSHTPSHPHPRALEVRAQAGPALSLPSVPFQKAGACFVYPPPPSSAKPKAVLQFLGGAFIGATPDVFYSHFIELLTSAGFLVLAAPYNVTFDHAACVQEIRGKFASAMASLDATGVPAASLAPGEISELPVFGVGHSNGALLHILSGTLEPAPTPSGVPATGPYKGSVIISYNNKSASEAVPYFNQVGPAVAQLSPLVESAIANAPGIALALAEQILETVERSRAELPELLPPEVADPVGRFADQIGPVLGQVQSGTSEFTPPPAENLKAVAASYGVPATLLIQFSNDSIDETRALEPVLRRRIARMAREEGVEEARVECILLTGTHATPLAPDVRWPVGPAFTPADAVAVALKAAALSDLRSLARTVTNWLKYQL